MSEKELLNLQCLVGNYLNGFKIVSVQEDPFIKGQINLFTDSTEDVGFGDRSVIKFWLRDEKSNTQIYRKQINKDTWILTEFEKWLDEKIKCTEQYADNDMAKGYINAIKLCKYYLQELKEGKK